MSNTQNIAFIGGGNMARSLIGGLLSGSSITQEQILVAEPVAALRQALADDFGVAVHEDTTRIGEASTWVFAVKPQVMRPLCESLATLAQVRQPLVISIAAGITSAQLQRWLGGSIAVVRSMPNTPALLGAGVTGLFASAQVDTSGRALADALLATAGKTVWIEDEALMDAVTGVSGSGPAYVFLLAEAMEAAALRQGLPADAARTLVMETIMGAARMLTETDEAAAELRRRVTSPGGTTQAAIQAFQRGGLEALVDSAIDAATVKGRELSANND